MENNLDFMNIPGPMLLALAIMVLLKAVKVSPIPHWVIPYLAFILGALGQCALVGFTVHSGLIGMMIGASAVGFHQGYKQLVQEDAALPIPPIKPDTFVTGLALAVMVCWVGCASPGVPPADEMTRVRRTAAIVQTASQLGTYFATKKEAEVRPYFEAAIAVLNLLLNDHVYAPGEVRAALAKITQRDNEDTAVAIAAAVNLYAQYFGDQVGAKLDQETYLRPVLVALRDGIALGLSAPATEAEYRLTGP